MATYTLNTPLTEEAVRKLKVRDTVILNGTIFGIRDLTLIHIFDKKNEPPVSLQGAVLLHTAPSMKKTGKRWEPICVGTTTSGRMDRFTPGLMEKYGARAIIGKGGQYQGSLEAMALMRQQVSSMVGWYLQQMNLPTHGEVVSLAERLTRLEMKMDDLNAKLDEVLDILRNKP